MNRNWLEVSAKSEKEAKIKIHGVIGGGFFEEGVTDEQVEADLEEIKDLKADVINVDLASLGGSVKHGMRIYDLLKSNSASINIDITGWTASMGAMISQAADKGKLRISENAQLLFHEARGISMGTASQLEADAKFMRNINSQFATIISRRSGMSENKANKLLGENNSEGIFKLPKEAKAEGLVDIIYKPESNSKMAATITQDELNKYKIKAEINMSEKIENVEEVEAIESTEVKSFDLGDIKNIIVETIKNAITPVVAEETEEVIEEVVADVDVEALVSTEVEAKFNEFKTSQEAKYSELEAKYNALKAGSSEPKGADASIEGEGKKLTEADIAAKKFAASISDNDKIMYGKKED